MTEQSRPGLVKAVILRQIIELMNVLVLLLQIYYMYYHYHYYILLLQIQSIIVQIVFLLVLL